MKRTVILTLLVLALFYLLTGINASSIEQIVMEVEDPFEYYNLHKSKLDIFTLPLSISLFPFFTMLLGFVYLAPITKSHLRVFLSFPVGYLIISLSYRLIGLYFKPDISFWIIIFLGIIYLLKSFKKIGASLSNKLTKRDLVLGLGSFLCLFLSLLVINVFKQGHSYFLGHGLAGYARYINELSFLFDNEKLGLYRNHFDEIFYNFMFLQSMFDKIKPIYLMGITNILLKCFVTISLYSYFTVQNFNKAIVISFLIYILFGQWGLEVNSQYFYFDSLNPLSYSLNAHRTLSYLFIPICHWMIFNEFRVFYEKHKLKVLILIAALGLASFHLTLMLLLLILINNDQSVGGNKHIKYLMILNCLLLVFVPALDIAIANLVRLMFVNAMLWGIYYIISSYRNVFATIRSYWLIFLTSLIILTTSNMLLEVIPWPGDLISYVVTGDVNSYKNSSINSDEFSVLLALKNTLVEGRVFEGSMNYNEKYNLLYKYIFILILFLVGCVQNQRVLKAAPIMISIFISTYLLSDYFLFKYNAGFLFSRFMEIFIFFTFALIFQNSKLLEKYKWPYISYFLLWGIVPMLFLTKGGNQISKNYEFLKFLIKKIHIIW